MANLANFNQNERKDTSNIKHFHQAVYELRLASNEKTMVNPDFLKQVQYNLDDQNKIGIAILNMDFTMFKPETFDSIQPLIAINSSQNVSKYVEIANVNTYQNQKTFVISSLVKEIKQRQQPTIFNFAEAFLERSENPIKNLSVDFGSGSQIVISNGVMTQPDLSYTFPHDGVFNLKYTFCNQNFLLARSKHL